MKKLDQKKILEAEIAYLKVKQAADLNSLKEQYHQTIESLTPLTILKNSFESIIDTPNLKAKLLRQALSLGLNFITKSKQKVPSEHLIQGVLGKIIRFALKKISRNKSS